jgi:hypothetical protein
LAGRIDKDLPDLRVELIEGRAGIFLVKLEDEVLWDKYAQNDEFPDEGFIVEKARSLILAPAES